MKYITETPDEYLIKISVKDVDGLEVRYYRNGMIAVNRNGTEMIFDVPLAKDSIFAEFDNGILQITVLKDYMIIPIG